MTIKLEKQHSDFGNWKILDYAYAAAITVLKNSLTNGSLSDQYKLKEIPSGPLDDNFLDIFTEDEWLDAMKETARWGAFEVIKTPHAADRYIPIEGNIYELFHSEAGVFDSVTNVYEKLGEEWLIESVQACREQYSETNSPDANQVPTANRVVNLNHNSQPYQEAVTKLDELHEAIRSKNDLNLTEEEKEQCLVAVKTQQVILSQDKVNERDFHETIIKSIQWVGEKCADEGIKQIIAEAAKWLLKLIPPL